MLGRKGVRCDLAFCARLAFCLTPILRSTFFLFCLHLLLCPWYVRVCVCTYMDMCVHERVYVSCSMRRTKSLAAEPATLWPWWLSGIVTGSLFWVCSGPFVSGHSTPTPRAFPCTQAVWHQPFLTALSASRIFVTGKCLWGSFRFYDNVVEVWRGSQRKVVNLCRVTEEQWKTAGRSCSFSSQRIPRTCLKMRRTVFCPLPWL